MNKKNKNLNQLKFLFISPILITLLIISFNNNDKVYAEQLPDPDNGIISTCSALPINNNSCKPTACSAVPGKICTASTEYVPSPWPLCTCSCTCTNQQPPAGSNTPTPAGSNTPTPAGSNTPTPAGSNTPSSNNILTPAEINEFITMAMGYLIGIAFASVAIVGPYIGFLLASPNPESKKKGQEWATSFVQGLIFLALASTIVSILGENILKF